MLRASTRVFPQPWRSCAPCACGLLSSLHSAALSTLVLAEHAGGRTAASTLNVIAAARQLGGEVTALVAGKDTGKVAEKVSQVRSVHIMLHWHIIFGAYRQMLTIIASCF